MKKLLIAFTLSLSAVSVMAQQTPPPPPPVMADSLLDDFEDDSDTSFQIGNLKRFR